MLKIGSNIKKLRELKGISRQYIADNVGMSLKTYGNIENDVTSPDIKTLEKIADAIEVSIYKIFNFDEKVILTNHGKHVENFSNNFHQYNTNNEQKDMFEKLLAEKDLRIKQFEELLVAKNTLIESLTKLKSSK